MYETKILFYDVEIFCKWIPRFNKRKEESEYHTDQGCASYNFHVNTIVI